eukprot:TRINITY_DN7114_c0_g1_i1.p1 TRINITY_DN7114_c0_g1~~TRINITY_DN7114_c0_g1_i1.p1  ORF type:complete len:566 (+),score=132.34 TRINITY_DN7114_c0_g1_i1:30-1700(+)
MSLSFQLGSRKHKHAMSPNTTLQEALVSVCRANGFEGSRYGVKFRGKTLDTSLTYRLSGLGANSTLEAFLLPKTAQTAQEVRIALQVEGEGRKVLKILDNLSLWDILTAAQEQHSLELIARASPKGTYMQPSITYTSKEINTNAELRSTALRSLGIQGSAVLRLRFVNTEQSIEDFLQADALLVSKETEKQTESNAEFEKTKEARLNAIEVDKSREKAARERQEARLVAERKAEAERLARLAKEVQVADAAAVVELETNRIRQERKEQQLQQEFKRAREDSENETSTAYKASRTGASPSPSPSTQSTSSTSLLSTPSTPSSSPSPVSPRLGDREAQAFAPTANFNISQIVVPESFYETTAEDLQRNAAIKRQKKNDPTSGEAQGFVTKRQRELARMKKLNKFKRCIVRIRFPDRTMLEGRFLPLEPLGHIFEFVEKYIREKGGFYLYTTPPRQELDRSSTKTMRDLGYLPAVLMHFGSQVDRVSPFMVPSLTDSLAELPPPALFSYDSRSSNQIVAPAQPTPTPSVKPSLKESSAQKTEKEKKAFTKPPSWLRLGK